jgi:hypothetical protein
MKRSKLAANSVSTDLEPTHAFDSPPDPTERCYYARGLHVYFAMFVDRVFQTFLDNSLILKERIRLLPDAAQKQIAEEVSSRFRVIEDAIAQIWQMGVDTRQEDSTVDQLQMDPTERGFDFDKLYDSFRDNWIRLYDRVWALPDVEQKRIAEDLSSRLRAIEDAVAQIWQLGVDTRQGESNVTQLKIEFHRNSTNTSIGLPSGLSGRKDQANSTGEQTEGLLQNENDPRLDIGLLNYFSANGVPHDQMEDAVAQAKRLIIRAKVRGCPVWEERPNELGYLTAPAYLKKIYFFLFDESGRLRHEDLLREHDAKLLHLVQQYISQRILRKSPDLGDAEGLSFEGKDKRGRPKKPNRPVPKKQKLAPARLRR